MTDITAAYIKGKGGGKRSLFVDHLISQGIKVKVVEYTSEIRGMKLDYVIVDEWVKENK